MLSESNGDIGNQTRNRPDPERGRAGSPDRGADRATVARV